MKLSYNWLKEYISTDLSPNEMADVLTMLGLETEGMPEMIGGVHGNFEGVVVGKVLSAESIPDTDHLSACLVDVGGPEALSIVCGAPNVAAGQTVPVATVGAKLYPDGPDAPFEIKKRKVRGVTSEGMICALDELALGEDHSGIMVLSDDIAVGTPFIEVAPIDVDYMIEIDLTPNRIDAASHYGTARDLAAFLGTKAHLPEIALKEEALTQPNPIPVTIQDPDKCKRYTSIYIKGATVGESPEWMKQRLITIGLRPRNAVVDVTNYVLHELGHPMHAFDADKLKGGKVIVRSLEQNQKFVTLEGEERELQAHTDLLICDAEEPHCIAGTMGGVDSGVTMETKNIFLESAYFDPGTVRRQAKRLGINSDSSYRFERGADPNMTVTAALRAASLIVEFCGGTASQVSDIQLEEFPPFALDISVDRTHKLLGKEIGKERMVEILQALAIGVTEEGDTLHLQVPPYRVDVRRPQDVMEEILRIYGYDNVEPAEVLSQTISFHQYQDVHRLRQHYADYLTANGFFEILNNSLVHKSWADDKSVKMLNPLSEELEVMRQSLLPGALETVQYNQNRKQEDLSLYEFGKTYWQKGGEYQEKQWLSLLVTGRKHPMHFTGQAENVSLYTLTREVERLQEWFGFEGKLRECTDPEFAYGLEMLHNGRPVLRYGRVNDALAATFDLRNEVFYLVADWALLVELYFSSAPNFAPIPLYPSVRRDISMLIDEGLTFAEIRALIEKANPKLIRSVELHDVYKGKNMAPGKKSYLVSIVLRDDSKTLEDKSVDKIVERVYQGLEKQLGVEIRR